MIKVLWAVLILISVSMCSYSKRIPKVLRPDTRRIGFMQLDTVVSPITAQFRAAFPNESAMCLLGSVRDTTVEESKWLLVEITEAIPAVVDSVDNFHVWFPIASGCEHNSRLVGATHSHTHLGYVCSHSDQDALMLFADKRLLFSMVFCADGYLEVLYQDGRRYTRQWGY